MMITGCRRKLTIVGSVYLWISDIRIKLILEVIINLEKIELREIKTTYNN